MELPTSIAYASKNSITFSYWKIFLMSPGRSDWSLPSQVKFLFWESLDQWLSNVSGSLESTGRLVKTQISGLHLQVFESEDLGWGLRICISNKFLDATALDLRTAFCKPLLHITWEHYGTMTLHDICYLRMWDIYPVR